MGGGSFPIRKIMLRFFGKGKALRAPISRTKAQHFFPKIGWGGGVRGRLEVFKSHQNLQEFEFDENPSKFPFLGLLLTNS